jgi:hypothetical protein
LKWPSDDAAAARAWRGPTRPYDLIKEFVIALVVIGLLALLLAAAFSSPDEPPATLASWAKADPMDFVTTALSELDGTSASATYGPPYDKIPGAGQKIGPLNLEGLVGVRIPISSAQDFVLRPLRTQAAANPQLAQAIEAWTSASPSQRGTWTSAYGRALKQGSVVGGTISVPNGDFGPVPLLMQSELTLARNGDLEGAMLTNGSFYSTDYTKPLLFLADGSYLGSLAEKDHLLGEQWGIMNEVGSYPGQTWLWLYTLWYQIPPFRSSGNADALVWGLMIVLAGGFALLPWIPGLRSLPRKLGAYRLIWRDYYQSVKS